MGQTIGDRIRIARNAAKKTQQALADHLRIKRPNITQWETGITKPEIDRLTSIAAFLNCDVKWLMTGDGAGPAEPTEDRAPQTSRASQETLRALGEASVEVPANPPAFPYKDPRAPTTPILGAVQGGDDGAFMFNGEAVEYVQTPSGLIGKKDVYGLRVTNDSMIPRFYPGEPLFASPHRAPVNGDYVVIEMFPEEGETAGRGYIKKLVRRNGHKVIVQQHNPAGEIEFDIRESKLMHRVFWPEELY